MWSLRLPSRLHVSKLAHEITGLVRVEGGLAPGDVIECAHGAAAVRRADALARRETESWGHRILAARKSRSRRVRRRGDLEDLRRRAG
jgi:hypothetical protein